VKKTAFGDAAAEFGKVALGDRRLNKRLAAIVDRAIVAPTASFPKMLPSVAEREALYRFVENDRVDWRAVVEPHHDSTAQRCREQPLVRVAHDTTWFLFDGNREGLGPVMKAKARGFAGHFSFALSADERRAPWVRSRFRLSFAAKSRSPEPNSSDERRISRRVS